jgi:hypothetical protein
MATVSTQTTPISTPSPTREPAPRRWLRAVNEHTLVTMAPPVPAHLRGAARDDDAAGTGASDVLSPSTTVFAAAVRAAAPGRGERSARSAAPAGTGFAQAIRAAAPGRRVQR